MSSSYGSSNFRKDFDIPGVHHFSAVHPSLSWKLAEALLARGRAEDKATSLHVDEPDHVTDLDILFFQNLPKRALLLENKLPNMTAKVADIAGDVAGQVRQSLDEIADRLFQIRVKAEAIPGIIRWIPGTMNHNARGVDEGYNASSTKS